MYFMNIKSQKEEGERRERTGVSDEFRDILT